MLAVVFDVAFGGNPNTTRVATSSLNMIICESGMPFEDFLVECLDRFD